MEPTSFVKILSKSAMDPGSDPGGGGGEGSGGPPATITRAVAGATGFATGAGVGTVMLTTLVPLEQRLESPVVLASMGLGWVEEARDMGEVGPLSG